MSNLSLPQLEPAAFRGGAVAVATAVIALLVAFTVPITDEQQTAIVGLIGVLAPIVAAFLIRPTVTPNDKVGAFENDAGQLVAGPAALAADGSPVTVDAKPRRATPGAFDPLEPIEPEERGL